MCYYMLRAHIFKFLKMNNHRLNCSIALYWLKLRSTLHDVVGELNIHFSHSYNQNMQQYSFYSIYAIVCILSKICKNMQNKNITIYFIMKWFVDITDKINNQRSQKKNMLLHTNPSLSYHVNLIKFSHCVHLNKFIFVVKCCFV
jgi:hypothetical protein